MYLKAKSSEIQKRRMNLGFTRHGLSKKAGLGPMALSRMEEGRHLVHPLRAKALAEVLECSVEDIFETTHEEELSNASSM